MRLLLICNRVKNIAATINEHIDSFAKYSQYDVDIVDLMQQKITRELLSQYDALIIHYGIWIELNYNLSPINRYFIADFKGPKFIFLQDENRHVNKLLSCLHSLNINIIFTCVPPQEIHKVYNESQFPGVKFINTRTGFVPQELLNKPRPSYKERKLDVVYRARKLSAWYGRLCFEKYHIADRFNLDADKYNLKVDISALESDRIYGDAWFEFLQSSKATLGVESGASMFDFTGEIREKVERHEILHPETSFDQLEKLYFPNEDYNVIYNQISPRHFEAAALKTLMILYEGEYSHVLVPWRHYVPLKKDHSNMHEIVNILNNPDKWTQITENCYNEVALNPDYTYPSFIRDFDQVLAKFFKENKIVAQTRVDFDNNIRLDDKTSLAVPAALEPLILSESKGAKNNIIDRLIKIKIHTRQFLANIYWRLDRYCNKHHSTGNILIKLFYNSLKAVKNSMKILDARFRKYDKTKNKLVVLLNSFYYSYSYNNNPLVEVKEGHELQFCLRPQHHHSNSYINKKSIFKAVFRKIEVCDECKWYIGL